MAKKEAAVEEKSKLQLALDGLNKSYGKGTVMILDKKAREPIEVIPTGSYQLDKATGVGGWPRGRIVEMYGPEGSGKTTLCLHAIANAQKMGLTAAIVDMEHGLDTNYAQSLGVDTEKLIFSQPDNGEQAFDVVRRLAESGEVGLIVLDSIAACVPQAELEREIGQSSIGKQAILVGQAMRVINPSVEKNDVVLIVTNQIRMKIGVMFGSPETTPGGEAVKFFASIRCDVRKTLVKEGDVADHNRVKVKILKNKVAKPHEIAEFNIEWGTGVDSVQEIIDAADEKKVIKIWGKKTSHNGLEYPTEEFKQVLLDNPELLEEIVKELKIKENESIS